MSCTVTLADINYSCDDLGIGGIVELHIANKEDVLAELDTTDAATRVASGTTPSVIANISNIGFNLKDGFSVFSEVKTVNADGTTTTVPTISVEIPKMKDTTITQLEAISKGGAELVAFVKTAAGTFHVSGLDYGLYASTVDANSGTSRAEKNRFQLTLTGEENGLSYSISESDFNTVVGN